jgi:hypothetical protein
MYSGLLFLYAFCLGGTRIKYGSKYIQDMSSSLIKGKTVYLLDENDNNTYEIYTVNPDGTYNLRKFGESEPSMFNVSSDKIKGEYNLYDRVYLLDKNDKNTYEIYTVNPDGTYNLRKFGESKPSMFNVSSDKIEIDVKNLRTHSKGGKKRSKKSRKSGKKSKRRSRKARRSRRRRSRK